VSFGRSFLAFVGRLRTQEDWGEQVLRPGTTNDVVSRTAQPAERAGFGATWGRASA